MALGFFHQSIAPEKLLSHMLSHNESHAEELTEIADCLETNVKEKVLLAQEAYKKGNELLAQAVTLLKEE